MILYGASGHGKVVLELCKLTGKKVECFVDDNPEIDNYCGLSVHLPKEIKDGTMPYLISIGNNELRKKIAQGLDKISGPVLHPSSIVSSDSKLGAGVVVMAGAIINPGTQIGGHVIVNTGATVDHDCIIEDFVHVSPNATLCGGVHVGIGTHIGAAAVVLPNIKIGAHCVVGAGAVVIRDLEDGMTVVGNPAKQIKPNGK